MGKKADDTSRLFPPPFPLPFHLPHSLPPLLPTCPRTAVNEAKLLTIMTQKLMTIRPPHWEMARPGVKEKGKEG